MVGSNDYVHEDRIDGIRVNVGMTIEERKQYLSPLFKKPEKKENPYDRFDEGLCGLFTD